MSGKALETLLTVGLGIINPLYGIAASTVSGAAHGGLEGALTGGLGSLAGGALGSFVGDAASGIAGNALSQTPDALTQALKAGAGGAADVGADVATGATGLVDELTNSIRSGVPTINTLDVGKGVSGTIGGSMPNTIKQGADVLGNQLGQSAADAGISALAGSSDAAPSGAISTGTPTASPAGAPGGSSGLPITNSTAPKIYPWVTDERAPG